jgi:hypothetical protein
MVGAGDDGHYCRFKITPALWQGDICPESSVGFGMAVLESRRNNDEMLGDGSGQRRGDAFVAKRAMTVIATPT